MTKTIRYILWAVTVIGLIVAAVWLIGELATSASAKDYIALSDAGTGSPLLVGIPCAEVDKPEMTYIGAMRVTGYDACIECCGKSDGITASGVKATVGHTVAMCSDYPFGTQIFIDGLGYYTVEDRGVGRGCVDVFCNDHAECYALTGYYDIYILGGN